MGVIAVCLIILLGGAAAVFFLHYKRKLPQSFYNVFSPRWKPVNTNEQEDDEERHPNILKKDLNETAMSEEGGKVDVNNMTTVTWTTDEKEDLKKAEVKAEKEDEKTVKDEKESEKESEKKEEKKEDQKEEEKPEEASSEKE